MTIKQVLDSTGLPCAYSHFKKVTEPRYLVYIGAGQADLEADDTKYWTQNEYQVEYYFKEKDEAAEARIEQALLDGGYLYTKSGDIFIKDENVFVIYYQVY